MLEGNLNKILSAKIFPVTFALSVSYILGKDGSLDPINPKLINPKSTAKKLMAINYQLISSLDYYLNYH